jgi:hypothetical protein
VVFIDVENKPLLKKKKKKKKKNSFYDQFGKVNENALGDKKRADEI